MLLLWKQSCLNKIAKCVCSKLEKKCHMAYNKVVLPLVLFNIFRINVIEGLKDMITFADDTKIRALGKDSSFRRTNRNNQQKPER